MSGWGKTKPSDFALRFLANADQHVKDVAGYALQQVIVRSPVLTGVYRNNHRVSLASPDNTYDLTATGSPRAMAEGAPTIAKFKLGGVLYIQNSLPYSIALENGHSQQAPKGVYTLAFQATVNKFK